MENKITILNKDFRLAAMDLLIKNGIPKANAALSISKDYKEALKKELMTIFTSAIEKESFAALEKPETTVRMSDDEDVTVKFIVDEIKAQMKYISVTAEPSVQQTKTANKATIV
jgi:hypothetical protein